MQVNRLSLGLQEELKRATNYNTARSETLFNSGTLNKAANNDEDSQTDFSSMNIEDLDISSEQISSLLNTFADEIINVFSGKFVNPTDKNNPNNPNPQNPEMRENKPQEQIVFTA